MRRAVIGLLVAAACSEEVTQRSPETAALDTQVIAPTPEATQVAKNVELPPGWSGTGVLAQMPGELPSGAPEWVKVRAEVFERNGQRVLATTGRAHGIKDRHLARTSAEARARHEIARWTKSERVVGSVIRETYTDESSGDVFARAELVVPEGVP